VRRTKDFGYLGSEGANDRAHDDQHRQPMAGIDGRHNGLGAMKGLVVAVVVSTKPTQT
jgi:hypothetical protein